MKDEENIFAGLVVVPEFPDYYIDEFNRVFSYKRKNRREILPWVQHYPTGTSTLRITLFTVEHGRRSVSYKKTLRRAYAEHLLFTAETFDQREATKAERLAQLTTEEETDRMERQKVFQQKTLEAQALFRKQCEEQSLGELI